MSESWSSWMLGAKIWRACERFGTLSDTVPSVGYPGGKSPAEEETGWEVGTPAREGKTLRIE